MLDQQTGLYNLYTPLNYPWHCNYCSVKAPVEPDCGNAKGQGEGPVEVNPEKEARKLKKKIRECDALVEKKSKGEALTELEEEKLNKLHGWNQELKQLETLFEKVELT